jgi:hypothetical protein
MDCKITMDRLVHKKDIGNKKLLLSKSEAMQLLGVGERAFNSLRLSYIPVGKRRKYALRDLENFIHQQRQQAPCLNPGSAKAHPTTGTTSRSKVIGIEAARKQIASKQHARS